jgi:hypothetical protein
MSIKHQKQVIILVLCLFFTILFAFASFAAYIKVYSSGQKPSEGDLCAKTISCEEAKGYEAWDNPVYLDVCCVDKPCTKEVSYYYGYRLENTWHTTKGYTVNYDQMAWACSGCAGVWEKGTNNGNGACCGDDASGSNPYGTIANVDDPDWGKTSCETCKVGQFQEKRHWSTSVPTTDNRCCGDDASDCAATIGSYLCIDQSPTIISSSSTSDSTNCYPDCSGNGTITTTTTISGTWYWRNAADGKHKGVIISSICARDGVNNVAKDFVSDGYDWVACVPDNYFAGKYFDNTASSSDPSGNKMPNPYRIGDHDYLCYLDGSSYRIGECCGGDQNNPDGDCKNDYNDTRNVPDPDFGGVDAYSGYSAKIGTKTFFCTENFTITQDLDEYPYACNHALYPNMSSRRYLWTGTKCCSEPQDSPEYYNDINGTGACFNSTPFRNGQVVSNLNRSLIVSDGALLGCNISSRHQNTRLLSLKDSFTNQTLIQNSGYCSVEDTGYYYCDYSGQWKSTYGRNLSNFVYVPKTSWITNSSVVEAGCCEPMDCWTGMDCYPNQAENPYWGPYKDKYRCAYGQWIYSEKKQALRGADGWCPYNNQCFIGTYPKDNDLWQNYSSCINTGQYIDDNYCDSGNWSSRTKILALALLSIPAIDQEYVLYCGSADETFNYFDYTLGNFLSVSDLFDEDQKTINNVCLLEFGNRNSVIMATSFNKNIDAEETGAVLPEFNPCNIPSNFTGFSSCNGLANAKAWLNNDLRSIVYSKQDFSLSQNPDIDLAFNIHLSNPINNLFSVMKTHFSYEPFSFSLNRSIPFHRVYAAKKGQKNAIAVLDNDKLMARYAGYPSTLNLCDVISVYNSTHTPTNRAMIGQAACIKSSPDGAYNIIAIGDEMMNINPYAIWSDLTGKLRLQ